MFRTQVVDSRNIRKTVAYKVGQIILIPVLLFLVAISFHVFGKDSAIEKFFRENQSSVIQPIVIVIVVLAVMMSIMMKSRMKNPRILGNLEMDEKGFRFLYNDKEQYSGKWSDTRFVSFEFYSSANINNPRGCMNYLTIVDLNGVKTFEFLIESSLVKADLGEFLRELRMKIPIKVSYSTPMKKIFRDNDFKF
jgi:hypothetical protein